MKSIRVLSILCFLMFAGSSLLGQTKSDQFKVGGNCNMCKKRIEGAATVPGVTVVNWNVKSKLLAVTFDPAVVSLDEIQKKIAEAGHDTSKFSAADSIYKSLPDCCLYERQKK